MRKKLTKESEKAASGRDAAAARDLKTHQVHDLAQAKIEETERIRKAFGIKEDYEEGSVWKRQREEREKAKEDELKRELGREKEKLRDEESHGDEESEEERSRERHAERRNRDSESEDDESDRSD